MSKLLSCEFNVDTGNVELRYADRSMISIDCTEVEYEFAHTVSQQSELDWLVYNSPSAYAKLVLGGNLAEYIRRAADPYSGIG